MTSIRQLANAPLVFVIAGVRFESLEALPNWVPAIQDELRKWFPSFKRVRQTASASGFEMAVDPQDFDPAYVGSAWVFSTSDHKAVITLFKTGLVLHTTDYSVFANFAEALKRAVTALLRAADGVVNITQLGIRYIDHIQSQHGMDVGKFIVSGLMPAEVSSRLAVKNSSSFASYVEENTGTTLNVRFNIGEGGPVIPQDLLPPYMLSSMPVSPQDGMFQFPMLASREGSLDLDALNASVNGRVISADELVAEVDRLHRVANDYFYSVITPEARKAWSSVTSNN